MPSCPGLIVTVLFINLRILFMCICVQVLIWLANVTDFIFLLLKLANNMNNKYNSRFIIFSILKEHSKISVWPQYISIYVCVYVLYMCLLYRAAFRAEYRKWYKILLHNYSHFLPILRRRLDFKMERTFRSSSVRSSDNTFKSMVWIFLCNHCMHFLPKL